MCDPGGGAPEIATCGRDGCVRVWDPRVRDAVLSIEPKEGEAARDCWTVTFGDSYDDDHRVLAAGYDNGDVKLFDMRTSTLRWETNVGNGVVCCEFDRKDIEMNKVRWRCLVMLLPCGASLVGCVRCHPFYSLFSSLAWRPLLLSFLPLPLFLLLAPPSSFSHFFFCFPLIFPLPLFPSSLSSPSCFLSWCVPPWSPSSACLTCGHRTLRRDLHT